MIIFHLFSIFILLPIPFFLVKLANGLLINSLWLSCCLSPELCHLYFIFLLNISMISLCFKTCGKMFYCNSQMLCSNIFWIMLLISPILLFISSPPSWCSIMRMNSLLIHFLFFICETMHFSRSRSCWRPLCERHQGSFQVWKFPFPSLLHLPPSSPPCLSPSLSFLPSCLPAFQSHLHRVRLLPTNLVCLSYLLFSSSSSAFWNKRNDPVTNLCMLLFLASDFSFIPQYICQFYVSTWLSHDVPRYLVKHYLRCFCGYFWVRLTFKSVEWLKLPHMWMGLIQSVGGLNRTKRLIPPSVRILLVWLPLDTEAYVWHCSLLAFGRELHHHLS